MTYPSIAFMKQYKFTSSCLFHPHPSFSDDLFTDEHVYEFKDKSPDVPSERKVRLFTPEINSQIKVRSFTPDSSPYHTTAKPLTHGTMNPLTTRRVRSLTTGIVRSFTPGIFRSFTPHPSKPTAWCIKYAPRHPDTLYDLISFEGKILGLTSD